MRVRIKNREHSASVQKVFMKLGWKWSSIKPTHIAYTDKPFLFIDNDMHFAYSDMESTFLNDETDEVQILHPKQMEFLKSVYDLNLDIDIIEEPIKTGYYRVKNAPELNDLIKLLE